ncbi:hypothetical protein GCM10010267_02600 [Streptomyces griseorubens]|nr:hypothetical protein GCM10010267_02600 [Streptomyces griseorubens]
MWWIGMGLGSVAGVVVLRVLLRQVRGLLLDFGDVTRAWTEVLSSIGGGEGRRVGCCAARYRCPGAVDAPRCVRRLK